MSRAAHVEDEATPSLADFTVACICPLGVECAAVEGMLDEIYDPLPTPRDQNAYTFGRLGQHNVVVAVMPQIGNNAAATTATQVLNDFPSLRFGLLVGIGGGVPDESRTENDEETHRNSDIRLGDVVVSKATDVSGGVVQYDLGKRLVDGSFQRTGHLNKPPAVLSANVKRLESQHRRVGNQIRDNLRAMLKRYPTMRREYQHPGIQEDRLFRADYTHSSGATCEGCDKDRTVRRRVRSDTDPRIHYGTIGSANVVVKSAKMREALRKDMGILCVEMEAAGLMDTFPCLAIRGICDYADSHKNKRWQPYAAATAAAYMKDLLMIIPPHQVKETIKAQEGIQAALGAVLDALEEPVAKIGKQVDQLHNEQEAAHRNEMLSWISTTPYEKYFRAARADILPNTGQWLFQNSEFGQWLQSKSGVFWLRGKPGAGKTKTSAMLVETLKTQEENIAFFFCSRSLNSSDRQDPKIILRSFVHQLSVRLQHDQFPKLLRETFRKRHSSGMGDEGLDYPECLEILNALLASDSSTTIVIDAIDECNMEDRNALLASLQQLLDLPGILLRIFISSRADPDITVRLNQWPSVAIEEALTRQDMERFVQREVTQAIERKLLLYGNVSSDLEAKIIGALLAKSGGMFLWVRLQLQLLCHMQTEYQVLSSLDSLPPTLRTTYDQIYEGIERSPSAHEAQTALAWLACARQPLRPDQWAVAVSWTIRKKARPEDKGVIYLSAETLLGMCQSLLIHDEMQNCITYAHVSVREYLESKGMLSTSELEFMGAEASLRFLINTRLPRPSQQGYRFYRYAARYWIDHVKGCGYSVPPGLDEFLGTGRAATQPYLEWKGAVELFCRRHREYHHADEIGTLTNGLLLAAHYGLGHIQMWKHSRYDPNITDERGFSLIAIASQNGQAGIVRTLLRNGAAVNPPRTPLDTSTAMCIYQARRSYGVYFQDPIDESHCLFLAIQGGHAEVVMLLLEAGATFVGISAFKVAARHGPPNVLLKILEQGTQEEVTDQILVLAAMNRRNPKTLETALQACPDQSITGHVLQAILEGRGDPKHIFKTYLAGRISAHVLTGIWRSQRREVLERLLAYIPDLLVLEETVLELESDALPGEDCVVEVLNSLLPGGTIMPTTLKAVFRIGEGAFCLMELLLRSKSLRSPQASDGSPNDTNNEEPLGQLFKRQVRFYVTDEAIVVAMQNEFDALKFAEIIFNLNSRQAISLEILKAAVNNEQLGGKLLDFFFSLDRDVPITEAIVAAAARNRFGGGLRMVDMLFSKAPGLQVTDTIIEAAAANSMSGSEILKWLLERRHTATAPDDKATFAARDGPKSRILGLLHMKNSGSAITEATVIAAVSSEFESMKTLPVLLARDPGLPITEKVLVAAAKNPERGFEIMKILLQQTLDVHIPESVFSAAVQNVMDASGLVGLLLSRADILTISEELVLSASRSPQGGGRVMADILSSDIISVKTSAVRAAAVTRQASWFSDFLSYIDHRTVRRQYGAIFMSAIEGGDAQILEQCLDIYSLWNGLDKHGWSTQLMAYYRHDDRVWDICRHHVGLVTARPLPPSSWKVRARDASGVRLEGAVLCLDGDKDENKRVRSDHPFIPRGTSYFEIEIVELRDPKKPMQGTRDTISMGAIDEFLQYSPAYYSNTGYVHDLFLTREAPCFRAGDVVGYGIDWRAKAQFVTWNGHRRDMNMCFEQLYQRRLFPFVCLYAGAGSCKVRVNFQEPFVYQIQLPG